MKIEIPNSFFENINPEDILNEIVKKYGKFKSYWFDSATNSNWIKLLKN